MLYTQTHTHTCILEAYTIIKENLQNKYILHFKSRINRITKIYFYINSFKTFMNVLWMGKDSYCSKKVPNVL